MLLNTRSNYKHKMINEGTEIRMSRVDFFKKLESGGCLFGPQEQKVFRAGAWARYTLSKENVYRNRTFQIWKQKKSSWNFQDFVTFMCSKDYFTKNTINMFKLSRKRILLPF